MVELSLEYVAGLYDGDGSFLVSVSKHPSVPIGYEIRPSIVLSLAERDSAVFNDIVETFQGLAFRLKKVATGNINLVLSKEEDVLVFLRKVRPHLRVYTNVRRATIMEEIVEKLVSTPFRKGHDRSALFSSLLGLVSEMRRYSKKVPNVKMNLQAKKDIERLIEESKSYTCRMPTHEYLAGLTDAEGYVGISIQRSPRSRFGYYPRFIVNLNLAIYDAGILYVLKEKLADLKPQVKLRYENNTAYFQISGVENVKAFIELIQPHSKLPSMRKRLALVKEAIDLVLNKEHYRKEGWVHLINIIKMLEDLSKRRRHKHHTILKAITS